MIVIWLSLVKKTNLLYSECIVRKPASEVQRSYKDGNVGTRCVPENDR